MMIATSYNYKWSLYELPDTDSLYCNVVYSITIFRGFLDSFEMFSVSFYS